MLGTSSRGGKIRKLVMEAIEEKIVESQKEYDQKCDEIEETLIERLEQIRLSAVSEKEAVAKRLVDGIIG